MFSTCKVGQQVHWYLISDGSLLSLHSWNHPCKNKLQTENSIFLTFKHFIDRLRTSIRCLHRPHCLRVHKPAYVRWCICTVITGCRCMRLIIFIWQCVWSVSSAGGCRMKFFFVSTDSRQPADGCCVLHRSNDVSYHPSAPLSQLCLPRVGSLSCTCVHRNPG